MCQCSLLDFDDVLGLYKILSLGKAGKRAPGNSILFLQLLVLNYLEIKSYFKKSMISPD